MAQSSMEIMRLTGSNNQTFPEVVLLIDYCNQIGNILTTQENCKIEMSPDRFNQCLRVIRWTPINIASALHCELSWIEAMESGNEDVPTGLAEWLETLAQAHEALPPPITYRGRRSAL